MFLIGPIDADDGGVIMQSKSIIFCSSILAIHRLGLIVCLRRKSPSTLKYLQWDLIAPSAKGSSGSESADGPKDLQTILQGIVRLVRGRPLLQICIV